MRLAMLLLLSATAANASTLHVGPGKGYAHISGAIADADDGDIIQIEPGQYQDCAIVHANNITIEGMGTPGKTLLAGRVCAGKGILVIDGNNVTIRNLTLGGAQVPDGNGAGIREEAANLTVDHVQFIDNQDGILANPSPTSTILVENSVFDRNGYCGDACAHAIYAGRIARLRVISSRFTNTRDGHAIKSRAARTEVLGNDITDGAQGTSSYLIEAPNGGDVVIRFNTLEKGPHTGNTTAAIAVGAEGVDQPTPEILVQNNMFANDTGQRTALLYNLSTTTAKITGNRTTGPIDLSK